VVDEVRQRTVADGIVRVTLPLPLGIDHVHCYLLRGDDGWMLVDTGLGLPGGEERWQAVVAELDAPVVRIVITHGHPDHVGDAVAAATVTGAAVLQGRADYEKCLEVWDNPAWPRASAEHLVAHGMPRDEVESAQSVNEAVASMIHFVRDPKLLDPGDRVDGWRVEHLPGHADGHIALFRDGTMIAGDVLLLGITPVVGLYPGGRPDPLADYLASLEEVATLAPEVAFAGHGPTVREPARRAREIVEHHRVRADDAVAAVAAGAADAYQVSLALFGELSPGQRRFAVAESLAHLEHLANLGRVERRDGDYAPV
jgi:glyoxylase-like metal-dependent hydrolase (beta-lactamase superfamily II)